MRALARAVPCAVRLTDARERGLLNRRERAPQPGGTDEASHVFSARECSHRSATPLAVQMGSLTVSDTIGNRACTQWTKAGPLASRAVSAQPKRRRCSSVKPQSHTSSLGSGVELSERTTSSKVRSETVDSILSAVAKKKVVTSDKGTENFESGNTGTTSKPPSSKPPQFRCAVPWSILLTRIV